MNYLMYIIVYFVVLVFENSLIHLISINGVVPDLSIIFLIFFSLKESQIKSTVAGFLIGLIQDIFSFDLIGLSSLCKSITGFIASYFKRTEQRYTTSRIALIVFVTSLVHNILYQIIISVGTHFRIEKIIFHTSLPGAIYTAVFAVIVNLMLYRMIWSRQP
ncbi:rod shape-determining protein MreD [candidate division KSB1 bacterium]|nr:rod shape-determining protein MreD [candidate division KSB1 bacterium]